MTRRLEVLPAKQKKKGGGEKIYLNPIMMDKVLYCRPHLRITLEHLGKETLSAKGEVRSVPKWKLQELVWIDLC